MQKKPPIKDTFSSVSSVTENVGAVRTLRAVTIYTAQTVLTTNFKFALITAMSHALEWASQTMFIRLSQVCYAIEFRTLSNVALPAPKEELISLMI